MTDNLTLPLLFYYFEKVCDFMVKVRQYGEIIERIKSVGLRPTHQRISLAKLLFEHGNRHVTAELLHQEASKAGVTVSLATIYNTLHQFSKVGLLNQIVIEAGRSYFDTNVVDHYHMFNEDTRILTDIDKKEITINGLSSITQGEDISKIDVIVRTRSK